MACNCGNTAARLILVRGDHATIQFKFNAGVLDKIVRATFTLERRGGSVVSTSGVIDAGASTITVQLTPYDTAVVGLYRADLELESTSGLIETPYLSDALVVDDVTKLEVNL